MKVLRNEWEEVEMEVEVYEEGKQSFSGKMGK